MKIPSCLIIGDKLEDIYLEGHWDKNRFKPEKKLVFPGGALNVEFNLKKLMSQIPDPQNPAFGCDYYIHSLGNQNTLSLYRLVDKDKTLETYLEPITDSFLKPYSGVMKGIGADTLILVDYNKGILNKPVDRNIVMPLLLDTQWLIVDSRYRSVHPSWLQYTNAIKIWRCTGNEYDAEWAEQFDIIVHTDGKNQICVFDTEHEAAETFEVPPITPIDTCGAGDTFTAALAACLLVDNTKTHNEIWESILMAIPFCIKAAQDVCLQPYTAITRVKL